MTKVLSMATMRVWQNNAPPGASETSAELNNFFYDTSSEKIYLCIDPTSGIQDWKVLPQEGSSPSFTSVSIGTPTITSGAGAPGSSQPKGSLYLRTDGSGVNDRMYVATDSIGAWTAVVTVA